MKPLLTSLLFTILCVYSSCASDVQILKHEKLYSKHTFVRDQEDRRYTVWTDKPSKVDEIFREFEIDLPNFVLKEGDILVVFLNDDIVMEFTKMCYSKRANSTFGDYFDSGIRYRLRPLAKDKKYSRITALTFTPVAQPTHIGMRSLVRKGVSDKR